VPLPKSGIPELAVGFHPKQRFQGNQPVTSTTSQAAVPHSGNRLGVSKGDWRGSGDKEFTHDLGLTTARVV